MKTAIFIGVAWDTGRGMVRVRGLNGVGEIGEQKLCICLCVCLCVCVRGDVKICLQSYLIVPPSDDFAITCKLFQKFVNP